MGHWLHSWRFIKLLWVTSGSVWEALERTGRWTLLGKCNLCALYYPLQETSATRQVRVPCAEQENNLAGAVPKEDHVRHA